MAIIPNSQQFHTQASDVDTNNKGSALANSQRKSFTMQDIIDTVSGGGGGAAFTQYIAYVIKGLTSWNVEELFNDTGLTLTWSNTNALTLHADVTGGTLVDVNNDIYAWATTNSPQYISGQDLQILGVQVQGTQVDVREARIQSDGSGIGNESSFSGYVVIRRIAP